MKKYYQNRWDNCTQTCIASLFEDKNIRDYMPKLTSSPYIWFALIQRYLRIYHNTSCIFTRDFNITTDGYYIVSGETVRTPKSGYHHCVIYKNKNLVHDPYSGGKGLTKPIDVLVITDKPKYYLNKNNILMVDFINKF